MPQSPIQITPLKFKLTSASAGGTIESAPGCSGQHLGFARVSYLSIRDVRFLGIVEAWNISLVDCSDVTISGVVINSGDDDTEDGIHINGGSRYVITGCDIRSGDDCIAIVQSQAGDVDPTNGTTDVLVANCYLKSVDGSALKVVILEGEALSVSRIRVANVVAKCGPKSGAGKFPNGIIIENESDEEGATLEHVAIDGFTLDASDNFWHPIIIKNAAHISLTGVVALNPYQRAIIDGCSDVELVDCVVDDVQDTTHQCLLVAEFADCDNIRIVGGRYRNSTTQAIVLGTANAVLDGFEVSGALIQDADQEGLLILNGVNGLVTGNRLVICDTYGIRELSPSNKNHIIGNHLLDCTTPIAFAGAATEAVRNFVEIGETVNDSGGFRQTIDGWVLNVAPAPFAASVEMPRNGFPAPGAGRFRAVRSGFITGIVVTTNATGAGTPLTVTAYLKSGGVAGGVGAATSLSVTMPTGQSRAFAVAPKGAIPFDAGDEIYLWLDTVAYTAGGFAIAAVEITD
jgi:hypothetical protein